MACGGDYAYPLRMHGWIANRQLVLQVAPLVGKLARTDRNVLNDPNRTDFGPVECVASVCGFVVNCGQVCVDGRARMRMRIETLNLWMMPVATRLATNDRLGQQSLAPQSNQTLRIKVFWMQ